MKPFNIERAKAGDPVVTRDGRKVRIGIFDLKRKDDFILSGAILELNGEETVTVWRRDGIFCAGESNNDLFMAPVKKGWANIHIGGYVGKIYDSEEEAINNFAFDAIKTVKITWEE